jgi:hypothetical protein
MAAGDIAWVSFMQVLLERRIARVLNPDGSGAARI